MIERARRIGSWVANGVDVDFEDVLLAASLGLIAYGFWDLYRPASFLVPGFVLLWLGLPPRVPFFDRTTPQTKEKKPSRK